MSIDSYILKKHERLSHWYEKKFGRNCFWLAWRAFYIGILQKCLFILAFFYEYLSTNDKGWLWITIILSISLIFWYQGYVESISDIQKMEEKVYKLLSRGVKNPLQGDEGRKKRVTFIVVSYSTTMSIFCTFFIGINWLTYGLFAVMPIGIMFCIFMPIALYFLSCTPLPPGNLRDEVKNDKQSNGLVYQL